MASVILFHFRELDNYIRDSYVRSILLLRAGTNAFALSLPVLASVLSFVTYSLSGSLHSTLHADMFDKLTFT